MLEIIKRVMKVFKIENIEDLSNVSKGMNLILGLFDGLHIGHVQLIKYAKYNSKKNLAVLTFDRNLKNQDNSVILSFKDKMQVFEDLGVDEVYIFKCDEKFKKITYIDFINKVLKKFMPISIYCGNDFRFGYKAQGDISNLKAEFNNVISLNLLCDSTGEKISTTKIKQLLISGEIEKANSLIGRNYYITGKVKKGLKNGSSAGFPTINVDFSNIYVIPKNGVYLTKVYVENKCYYGMTNVGVHPTISELNKPISETYIFDFNKKIYGETVKIEFLKYIREEKKFENFEELTHQLKIDEENIKKMIF